MAAPFDLAETDRLLSTTRAVRKRLDLKRPVERSVILDCIRLSMQAPTGSNSLRSCNSGSQSSGGQPGRDRPPGRHAGQPGVGRVEY